MLAPEYRASRAWPPWLAQRKDMLLTYHSASRTAVAARAASPDLIIRCCGVGKAFQLYRHQNDQLKQIVLGLWKKFYTEKWVLTDVNFDIAKGERVGIVGHNGAGKTTLLQMLCGITQPTTGSVTIDGRIAPILALGSGFDGALTGRENAIIGGAILGLKRKDIVAKLDQIAEFAEIGDYPPTIIPVRRSWAAKDGNGVRLSRAIRRAKQWLYDPKNHDEALKIVEKHTKCSPEIAEELYQIYFVKDKLYNPDASVSLAGLNRVMDVMTALGHIPQGHAPKAETLVIAKKDGGLWH